MPDLPWSTVPDPKWVQGIDKQTTWESSTDYFQKSVMCPTCNHTLVISVPIIVTQALRASLAKPPAVVPERVMGDCNCGRPHEGRPNGFRGCGQRAPVAGPGASGQSIIPAGSAGLPRLTVNGGAPAGKPAANDPGE